MDDPRTRLMEAASLRDILLEDWFLDRFRFRIVGIEVTQAIQFYSAASHLTDPADRGADNSVRLIAGKPAWVRAYVRAGWRSADIPGVTVPRAGKHRARLTVVVGRQRASAEVSFQSVRVPSDRELEGEQG